MVEERVMDWDELPRKPREDPLSALEREELETFSRDELEHRIRRLEREIARTRTVLEGKTRHAAEIDRLFGRGSD